MYRIGKSFEFAAAHQLSGLQEGHQCSRLHGHTYRVELCLEGEGLDEKGMLLDFNDLVLFKRYVNERLDHRFLNDVLAQPTVENLAAFLHGVAQGYYKNAVARVTVWESTGAWAAYE